MGAEHIPGGYNKEISRFELEYWENFGGVEDFDRHFSAYSKCFPILDLDFDRETILDIGSGAVSVFEKTAPEQASITPYDLLADDYNRIAPNKKFAIHNHIPEQSKFSLITLFNMIDHVVDPAEILAFANRHMEKNGRLWLAVHLYQPHGPKGHPQNFSCGGIVDLVSKHFRIDRCGVIRESVPIPYLWVAELSKIESSQSPLRLVWFKFKLYLVYAKYQCERAGVKGVKLFGLRSLLPKEWQF